MFHAVPARHVQAAADPFQDWRADHMQLHRSRCPAGFGLGEDDIGVAHHAAGRDGPLSPGLSTRRG
jgi:hypothetical protein